MPGEHGKVDPAAVETRRAPAAATSIIRNRACSALTQSTELGTVYTPAELRRVGDLCRRLGLRLHMDGARFANALASLGAAPRELTWQAGVDVLTFGGTKNGMAVGEAVVFFNRDLAEEFDYRCKQAGQLASKMRFLAAPWVGMLREGALLRHAAHANACARRLAEALAGIAGGRASSTLVRPMPSSFGCRHVLIDALRARGWLFYTFIGSGQARFMCSWSTTEEDVRALVADVAGLTTKA